MNPGGAPAVCALCGAKAQLKRSHIIPRFVSRALEVPDGPIHSLLCGECEDLFSGYESTFARVVFHPLFADGRVVAKYDKWLLKFSVSVCWRILEERLAQPAPDSSAQLVSCREVWRRFLTGKQSDMGAHPVHLLLTDPNANPKAIGMKVVQKDGDGFVFAQLGPVILFGLISAPDPRQWQGTRVHLEGKLKPRKTVIPARYRDYLSARADHAAMA